MDNIEKFIQTFGGLTEEYLFYNGTVTLRYDPVDHVYLLLKEDGGLEPVEGVSSVSHIIDKSVVLIPWACKMMSEKFKDKVYFYYDHNESLYKLKEQELDAVLKEAKSAHKDKLEDAGNVGHIAHAWIEQYIKYRIKYQINDAPHLPMHMLPEDERAANCCTAALDWMNKHKVRWIYTERKVYSRIHKYAGTMDGLCLVDSCNDPLCCPNSFKDRLSVADWKSSNYLYPEYLMQTAAYEAAYIEEFGTKVQDRWLVRLGKEDAKFEVWHLEDDCFEDDFNGFLAALQLTRQFTKIEERLASIKDVYRKGKKQAKKEALSKKCRKADKYQGKRKPSCGCEYCLNKYSEVQANKQVKIKTPKKKKVKPTSTEMIKSLQNVLDK